MSRADAAADDSVRVHLGTAPGAGGVAVVELFGSGAPALLAACFRARRGGLPVAGEVRLGRLIDGDGEALDDVVVASVGAEESWCGLAGWTVSCHGGPIVAGRVVRRLESRGALRSSTEDMLEAARRAGRLDRIQGLGFSLCLRALTERAALYFLRMYRGELSFRLRSLAGRLGSGSPAREAVAAELEAMLRLSPRAVRLGEPLRVLLAGRTNVGKSTLFNRLLGQERVVVSARPGTTRDLIEETIEIEGYPVTLIDSAGLRGGAETGGVERAGIRRALAAERDAVLFLTDAHGPPGPEDRAWLEELAPTTCLTVRTKADLCGASQALPGASDGEDRSPLISARTGEGLAGLRAVIRDLWLGPAEDAPLPPLPFTSGLVESFRDLLGLARDRRQAGLDGVRRALIECLGLGPGPEPRARAPGTGDPG